MTTVIEPSVARHGVPLVNQVAAFELKKGTVVTNMGIIDGVERVGTMVVATIRGTLWTLGTGKGDVVSHDVVWHESQAVTVDQL